MKRATQTTHLGYTDAHGNPNDIYVEAGQEFADDHPAVTSRPEFFQDGPAQEGGVQALLDEVAALRAKLEQRQSAPVTDTSTLAPAADLRPAEKPVPRKVVPRG